ncbi:MAG TPA: hypothetical protein VK966_11885, partial [Longimicrobiales bacterium]|nr:hypothetical protein [Longimicrobiales bacterium]
MAETAQHSIDRYTRRRDDAAAQRDRHTLSASRISNLRLLAFMAIIGALVWAELRPEMGGVAFTLVVLAALAFFALIAAHARVTRKARRAEERAAVNDEGIARITRDWDALP